MGKKSQPFSILTGVGHFDWALADFRAVLSPNVIFSMVSMTSGSF